MPPPRRRSYRELQADAARGMTVCPRCGNHFAPLSQDGTPALPVQATPPAGYPDRDLDGRRARLAALEPRQRQLQEQLQLLVSSSTYHLWLAPLRLVDAAGETLYVAAPAEILRWVADRFGRVLEQAASTLADRPIDVVVMDAGAVWARTLAPNGGAPDPTRRSEPDARPQPRPPAPGGTA